MSATPHRRVIERTIDAMSGNIDTPLTIDALARSAGFSRFHFSRIFTEVTGVSPTRFYTALRLHEAKRLLLSTELTVADVANQVGYTSTGTFSSSFKASVGVPPITYRTNGGHAAWIAPAPEHDGPGTGGITGEVLDGETGSTGPVFVGLFSDPILQGPPLRYTVLDAPGRPYHLNGVPEGTWHVMAYATPASATPAYETPPYATPAPASEDTGAAHRQIVGSSGPVLVTPHTTLPRVDIELRPMRLTDPPVLLARPDPREVGSQVRTGPLPRSRLMMSEYASYLTLDEILSAQHPRSEEHDELLFIIAHQVHELWFKQLLHELARLQTLLVEGDTIPVSQSLSRATSILKVVVTPIDVLDTLTPNQFLSFREKLGTGSGFQSAQFREIEVVLSRRERVALQQFARGSEERTRIEAAMARPSVFDSFLHYLAAHGHPVPARYLERDITRQHEPSADLENLLLDIYQRDPEVAYVCDQMVELDQCVQDWRFRHVSLVERLLGRKVGTGGTTGSSYLRTTLFHPVFPDLWSMRSHL